MGQVMLDAAYLAAERITGESHLQSRSIESRLLWLRTRSKTSCRSGLWVNIYPSRRRIFAFGSLLIARWSTSASVAPASARQ